MKITEFLEKPVRVSRTFVAVFYYSCWAIIIYCFNMSALTEWRSDF